MEVDSRRRSESRDRLRVSLLISLVQVLNIADSGLRCIILAHSCSCSRTNGLVSRVAEGVDWELVAVFSSESCFCWCGAKGDARTNFEGGLILCCRSLLLRLIGLLKLPRLE